MGLFKIEKKNNKNLKTKLRMEKFSDVVIDIHQECVKSNIRTSKKIEDVCNVPRFCAECFMVVILSVLLFIIGFFTLSLFPSWLKENRVFDRNDVILFNATINASILIYFTAGVLLCAYGFRSIKQGQPIEKCMDDKKFKQELKEIEKNNVNL